MTRTYDFDPLRTNNSNWEIARKDKQLGRQNQFLKMNAKQLDAIKAHFESQYEWDQNEKMKISVKKMSLRDPEKIDPMKFDKACCCCCCTACCSCSKD